MNISRPLLKNNAKVIIRTAKPSVLTASFIFIAVSALLGYLSRSVAGVSAEEATELLASLSHGAASVTGPMDLYARLIPSPVARFLMLALKLVSYIVSAGYLIFLFNIVKKSGAVYGNLLDGFGITGKLVWLSFLQELFVLLLTLPFMFLMSLIISLTIFLILKSGGSAAAFLDTAFSQASLSATDPAQILPLLIVFAVMLLLITVGVLIPMLFFTYRYRMGLYLLLDHPEMRAIDCLHTSKQMMKGHKWECFKLDLSFLGWFLLVYLPSILFATMPSVLPLFGTVLSYAILLWVQPYFSTTYVLYYMALAGKPVTVAAGSGANPCV